MVTIDGTNKFFGRVSTGKYPMSVDEIGRGFSEHNELQETISRWRSHRAELIEHGNGPVKLTRDVTMLFDVIPADSFAQGILRESWRMSEQEKSQVYVPHQGTSTMYNADGFLRFASTGTQSEAFGYTQLFRSGIVEYADGFCCNPPPGGGHPMILGQELEKQMVQCYEDAINRFRRLGRSGVFYVDFSLIGIAGRAIFAILMSTVFGQHLIRQNIFSSPEVLVDINEPEESPYGRTLLPLVDTMWQVGGREGIPFKPKGVWNPFGLYQ